jgi:hypothetical protein
MNKKAKNWKTTVFGIMGLAAALLTSGLAGEKGVKIGTAITAISAAGVGIMAKDRDMTGGTREQSSTPKEPIEE